MGVSSTFGCIPIDVVLANTMPSSGWKLSKSLRDNALPPIASASSTARSSKHTQHQEQRQTKEKAYHQCQGQIAWPDLRIWSYNICLKTLIHKKLEFGSLSYIKKPQNFCGPRPMFHVAMSHMTMTGDRIFKGVHKGKKNHMYFTVSSISNNNFGSLLFCTISKCLACSTSTNNHHCFTSQRRRRRRRRYTAWITWPLPKLKRTTWVKPKGATAG